MSDDLRDLDDEELLHRWLHFKHHHDEDEWVAEFGRRSRRIGQRLADSVTAWRGSDEAAGMSWTPEQHIARHFASRNHAPLWKATIRPSAILAVIETDTGWTEYVVDPSRLGSITAEAAPARAWHADPAAARRARIAAERKAEDERYERNRARIASNTGRNAPRNARRWR